MKQRIYKWMKNFLNDDKKVTCGTSNLNYWSPFKLNHVSDKSKFQISLGKNWIFVSVTVPFFALWESSPSVNVIHRWDFVPSSIPPHPRLLINSLWHHLSVFVLSPGYSRSHITMNLLRLSLYIKHNQKNIFWKR